MLLPRCTQSNTESEEPSFERPYTDIAEPNRAKPIALNELPSRFMHRRERLLPTWR
jgi:hypothetical protein